MPLSVPSKFPNVNGSKKGESPSTGILGTTHYAAPLEILPLAAWRWEPIVAVVPAPLVLIYRER